MTKHTRSTNDLPMKSSKAPGPVEHAQPGPDGYLCQSPEVKFPGEPAVSDTRVSSAPQADHEKVSLPKQRKANQDTADRLGLDIICETSGPVSGADEDAKRLDDIYAWAEAGVIRHAVFATFDRAFRRTKLAEIFVDRMRLLGIHVWVEGRCISHADAHANAMNQMRHMMSEHERNVLRERAFKKAAYAQKGTTYRRVAPPGFRLEPIPNTKKAMRLAVIPQEKSLLHAIFLEVSCNGLPFTYSSTLGKQLKEKYPQIQSIQDVSNLIRDKAYLGLNTHGAFAFETPYTEENRIVGPDLFQNANQKLLPPERRRASLGEVAGKIGTITLVDGLLEHLVVLCMKCLSLVHRGRFQEHQGLVCPTLECRGTPLDFEALAKIQKERGRVEASDLEAAQRPKGAVHESVLVSAAGQQDARASQYRCDHCFEIRLSQFTFTDGGARKYLWCKSCRAGRWIPRPPWQEPPAKRPFKQSLAPWVPKAPRIPRKPSLNESKKPRCEAHE